MIRSELADKISWENPHLTKEEADRVVRVVFEEIIKSLSDGGRVELRGFGAFSVRAREARPGRNPKTGEAVDVVSKHVPFFKTGKLLKQRLNGG